MGWTENKYSTVQNYKFPCYPLDNLSFGLFTLPDEFCKRIWVISQMQNTVFRKPSSPKLQVLPWQPVWIMMLPCAFLKSFESPKFKLDPENRSYNVVTDNILIHLTFGTAKSSTQLNFPNIPAGRPGSLLHVARNKNYCNRAWGNLRIECHRLSEQFSSKFDQSMIYIRLPWDGFRNVKENDHVIGLKTVRSRF